MSRAIVQYVEGKVNWAKFRALFLPRVNNVFTLLGLAFFLLSITSCKQQQKIKETSTKCNLIFKSSKVLTSKLTSQEFRFDRFSGKLNAETKIDSSYSSFTVSLRIKKDSVIWMSLSKLGIEGARVLVTTDSVSFMNRLEKIYFKGDFSYLSRLLNVQLDFELLQSLLVGNSVSYYKEEEKIKAGVSKCMYMLGTIRKSKLRKVVKKGKELKEPAQIIYLEPETFKISQIQFHEFNPDRSFGAEFKNFTNVDSVQFFPLNIDYNIKADKEIDIAVNYTKIRLNEKQGFPFRIPQTYEKMTYNEKK